MKTEYDAIIVGGGHNGLTSAGYLAKAGLKTLVLESRYIVGGACVTEEFHPGYRASTIPYVISLLQAKVIEDLELKKHGYETLEMRGHMVICNDEHMFRNYNEEHDRKEVARFSETDYDSMKQFSAMVQNVGEFLRKQMLQVPPKLDAGVSDLIKFAKMGLDIKSMTPDERHRFAQLMTSSAYDIINRWFDSDMIKSMYGSSCFSGNYASLRQPGSAIPFFHLAVGEIDGVKGDWRMVKGGMGGITQAMASFAESKGAEIRTSSPVGKILVENGKAVGVKLEDGEEIRSRCVLSSADPKRTFLKLIDSEYLDTEFAKDIKQIRYGHSSPRISLALKGLPDFKFFPSGEEGPWHSSDITIFPDIEGQEANYFAAAQGRFPKEPRLDITIPSTVDDTLAPPGHHVMTILAKYYPYKLADGINWDDVKEKVADDIIDYLSKSMPNIKELIVGRLMISTKDLESEYNLTEGDIFHGRHDLDQLFSMRPHPKAAQYSTPVKNLYLCGSGSHPGGGVTGAPGHNAAQVVISDLR